MYMGGCMLGVLASASWLTWTSVMQVKSCMLKKVGFNKITIFFEVTVNTNDFVN